FNVGRAVEWVHQQPARSGVQRQRHRIHGEIPSPQVFNNRCWSQYRRLARLLIALNPCAADLGADSAWQGDINDLEVVVGSRNHRTRPLQFLLQFKGIALDGEIQVADGEAADDVSHCTAGEVNIHPGGAGDLLNQGDALLLVRRQPELHRVYVVSHSWSGTAALQLGPAPVKISTALLVEYCKSPIS